ncbi:hypothetical protein [Porphyrobacter sp. AAP82]|uniref:hypothetical protein n=1 Tax=Porphyrobacter sp. AAP82 TaxID=1248917 RepID=UPI000309F2BE|nr:hypothetical protein [Porphyrobacter sp. AAP82]
MATDALGGRPLPFKIPTGVDALKARDAEFWRLHACWRLAETEFETWDACPDECPHSALLFDRATELRDAMLSHPVRTGAALAMKIEAVREGDWGSILSDLPCGMTVAEVIEADAGRIAKAEIWGADAFADLAEG